MDVNELIAELRKIANGESGLGAGYEVMIETDHEESSVDVVDVDHESKKVWLY